ncbi:aminoacyl-histidine dipeptidase [Pseudobacillus wudalianchiensis]|uniref:Cytosol non-specific dipeptidase n=1 Tax=Pseudobacillus wudalianchiensis TaxID=1743143 RepID=A0A1B9B2S2_9BACI|nr:aminoacyl-histidine dipeptidase [Bacillus wudalianchiensis]OCA90303.1 aminoacyl-histidine dipeptidase [Bacillus wudalianchiensis]
MYNRLEDLIQHPVFHYFSEISKIPRCSGNEKAISDYLVQFGKERNLEVKQDEALNVIIKKPASPGYENVPPVIIQGHMDMVCEKNKGTIHDFRKDPIQLRVIEEMLYATNTTLGADNGIAVAYALALLDSKEVPHPSLEVVITTEEETTMGGALALNPADFEGKILINLDSEEDHKLLVSSAGGIKATMILPIIWDDAPKNVSAYCIGVRGLKGGHSGISINKGRGNSNKIMGRILEDLSGEFPYFLQQINGGSATNAIPRETDAIILVSRDSIKKLESKIDEWNDILRNELKTSDPEVHICLDSVKHDLSKVFSEETKQKAITSLMLIPNGIQSMSMEMEGLVESSTNLGVITTFETELHFESDSRSSIKSLKDALVKKARLIAETLGCKLFTDSEYPEWPYNPDSKIRKVFEKVFKEKHGTDIEIIAVHAGIECGILIDKIPGLDAISIGPDMYNVHTPNEHLSIPSTINNWEYFLSVLKEMKFFDR